MEYRDSSRSSGASASPAADQEKAQCTQCQRVGGGDGVVQHDGSGRHPRGQPEAAAEHERPGHLQVAQVARTGGDREAQEQRGVGRHRLEQRHVDGDGREQQREVERVDHEREHGEAGKSDSQLRRPQPACPRAKREGLAGQARGETSRQQASREPRAGDAGSRQRGPQDGGQQRDGQRGGAREATRRVHRPGQRNHFERGQKNGHRGQVACLVDDDGRQSRAGRNAMPPP